MEKQRIQVYADAATKKRIQAAAAKHNMAVTDYCLNAIHVQLAEDEYLDAQTTTLPDTSKANGNALVDNLRALHQEILAYRQEQPLDVDQTLQELREERAHELTGLR